MHEKGWCSSTSRSDFVCIFIDKDKENSMSLTSLGYDEDKCAKQSNSQLFSGCCCCCYWRCLLIDLSDLSQCAANGCCSGYNWCHGAAATVSIVHLIIVCRRVVVVVGVVGHIIFSRISVGCIRIIVRWGRILRIVVSSWLRFVICRRITLIKLVLIHF